MSFGSGKYSDNSQAGRPYCQRSDHVLPELSLSTSSRSPAQPTSLVQEAASLSYYSTPSTSSRSQQITAPTTSERPLKAIWESVPTTNELPQWKSKAYAESRQAYLEERLPTPGSWQYNSRTHIIAPTVGSGKGAFSVLEPLNRQRLAWNSSRVRDFTGNYPLEEDPTNNVHSPTHTGDSLAADRIIHGVPHPQRRLSSRDEFDGPHQLLEMPVDSPEALESDLPRLPMSLYALEQDNILSKINDRLSQCAFDFVARYQFPIPIESDKRPVRAPSDREWTEWVYLLKRLATKRRIPARVLYNGQVKQLITVLENSLEMRHAAKHQSRPLKDDRNILQLVSAGIQVTKILKDAAAMQYLDALYVQTENLINSRKPRSGYTV
ncbi:hypothetical protein BJ546DRAFT_300730 [Cryomyces antarcticus]|uniref:Uncharacterized protein n=1 Tax=Cryomyces antarcticus TaxID=329879 RepID=A0ABR0MAJ8_9PEZI|nr:hypothetical protein LTR39_001995 [Cryomyces antarcticus]KAK5295668.1 hypothetical protein LTR16_000958 [Cryomyces antarcticus]